VTRATAASGRCLLILHMRAAGSDKLLILAACRSIAGSGHRSAKLSTEPGTRAERFYLRNGWLPKGTPKEARPSL